MSLLLYEVGLHRTGLHHECNIFVPPLAELDVSFGLKECALIMDELVYLSVIELFKTIELLHRADIIPETSHHSCQVII